MGSEDLFHKRKQQDIKSLKRRVGNRQPYDFVLIVCEDKKTEPNYFNGLRDELKLHTANIKISNCPNGNDPVSIVSYTIAEFEKIKDYDRIFCVFDGEHANYQAALDKIKIHYLKGIPVYAIVSIPCFEYWLLLHFVDSSRPYMSVSGKSAGDQLKSEIKQHIKNYSPRDKNIFEKTRGYLDIAIMRAKRIEKQQKKAGTNNPSTNVYQLVEYLNGIKNK